MADPHCEYPACWTIHFFDVVAELALACAIIWLIAMLAAFMRDGRR